MFCCYFFPSFLFFLLSLYSSLFPFLHFFFLLVPFILSLLLFSYLSSFLSPSATIVPSLVHTTQISQYSPSFLFPPDHSPLHFSNTLLSLYFCHTCHTSSTLHLLSTFLLPIILPFPSPLLFFLYPFVIMPHSYAIIHSPLTPLSKSVHPSFHPLSFLLFLLSCSSSSFPSPLLRLAQ